MKYNPEKHHRRSIRLKGYDYSQAGFYFVTICCKNMVSYFGQIRNQKMILNDAGKMIEKWYYELENKYPDIKCHEMVVMPNHFHCIIENTGIGNANQYEKNVGADLCVCPKDENNILEKGEHIGSPLQDLDKQDILDEYNVVLDEHKGSPLYQILQWFKTMSTNEYIRGVKKLGWKRFDGKLWQRNYYEHIIRNQQSFEDIGSYIVENPINWENDKLNNTNQNMKFLRTPSERFKDLEGYTFKENYIGLGNKNEDGQEMRMHYLDEGDGSNGKVMVLLHGEPSWSYLYRKMIPIFVENGFRVIAPDLIGFGKSDKPTATKDYTYQSHLDWLEPIFADLGLKNITLFLQDWGGLLGLRLLEKYDAIIDNLVLSNTFLPEGLRDPGPAFTNWQKFALNASEFPVGNVINMGTASNLSKEVLAGYEAPFPDESYKAGARIFPAIVPIENDNPEAIINRGTWKFLEKYEKPVLTLFGDSDPIMKNAEKVFMKRVPGTKGQPHEIIKQGGHFIQEDKGEELAEKIVQFLKDK